MKRFLLVGLLMIVGFPALAGTVTSSVVTSTQVAPGSFTIDNSISIVDLATRAFHDKDWAFLSGLALSFVVFLLRKTNILAKLQLDGEWGIRGATLILSLATGTALGLQSHEPAALILRTAVTIAVSAVGSWELLGQGVRDTVKQAQIAAREG